MTVGRCRICGEHHVGRVCPRYLAPGFRQGEVVAPAEPRPEFIEITDGGAVVLVARPVAEPPAPEPVSEFIEIVPDNVPDIPSVVPDIAGEAEMSAAERKRAYMRKYMAERRAQRKDGR